MLGVLHGGEVFRPFRGLSRLGHSYSQGSRPGLNSFALSGLPMRKISSNSVLTRLPVRGLIKDAAAPVDGGSVLGYSGPILGASAQSGFGLMEGGAS